MYILPFIIAATAIELTPGPNMAYLSVVTLQHGRKAGFAVVAGVLMGLVTVGTLVSFGFAAFIADTPILYQVLRWVGTLYLFWLAWKSWVATSRPSEPIKIDTTQLITFFKRGLIVNILNPKAFLFYVSVVPKFLGPDAGKSDLWFLVAIYVSIATIVHVAIVALSGIAHHTAFQNPTFQQNIGRIMAILLVVIGIWLLWATRLS